MSYNDLIDAAVAAINQHNEAVGEGKPGVLNSGDFFDCVKASGGTNEDRLAALSHEDLLACMPESTNGVKPRVLAKEIANIFRNKTSENTTGKKVEKMTLEELLRAFDPEDHTNPVGVRLRQISKGEKFIVYSDGRVVHVESTLKLILEIKGGYNGRDDVNVNGVIKKVYRIGELPENYADENPLYKDRPLRPDGTCDQTGRSWEGVDLSIRQLVRLAMNEGELKVSHETAHNILDIAMEADGFKKLRSRYRKASIKFDELVAEAERAGCSQRLRNSIAIGNLPKLRIPLNPSSKEESVFSDGKRVVWGKSPDNPNAYRHSLSDLKYRGMDIKK